MKLPHTEQVNAYLVLAILTLLTACSHVKMKEQLPPPPLNLRPPNIEMTNANDHTNTNARNNRDQLLMQLGLTHQEKNVQWYVNYRRAQLWVVDNPALACELFGQLATESLFPLNKVARLHAFQTCDANHIVSFKLGELNWHKEDPDLRPFARDIALQRTLTDRNSRVRLTLLLEKSRDNIPLSDRIDTINEALQIAQSLKEESAINEAQQRLYRLAPRLNPNPKRTDILAVAQDYRHHREFQKAENIYISVLRDKSRDFFEKVQAWRGLRQNYKLSLNRAQYVQTSADLAHFVAQKFLHHRNSADADLMKTYLDVSTEVARTLWTNGRVDDAKKILLQMRHNLTGRVSLSEVNLILGRIAEERKDSQKALAYFNKALEQPNGPAAKVRLLWFVAWNQRKLRQYQLAVDSFEQIRLNTDDPFVRNRTTFWLVKCLQALGDTARAEVELKQLIQDDPLGYYGLLAYRELKLPIPARTIAAGPPARPSEKLKDDYNENYFNWLLSVQESELGQHYLDGVSNRLTARQAGVDEWQELLSQYAHAEAYAALNDRLSRLPTAMRIELLQHNPEFLFPSPYSEIVDQAAQQFQLSPEFIYSIMRQESSFNPTARSMADAFGLMQLLPEVAVKAQTQARVAITRPEDLFNPQINIPIGAAYLRQLWDRYHGQFVLVVANYNAAEDAIQTWLNTRWRGDTLEFVEDIPYEETRGYIRLVLRNLIFYSLLKAPPQGLTFPEWVLEIKPLST
jgi:soluble lytic murein transglycosylase